jgi:hypothetical protein
MFTLIADSAIEAMSVVFEMTRDESALEKTLQVCSCWQQAPSRPCRVWCGAVRGCVCPLEIHGMLLWLAYFVGCCAISQGFSHCATIASYYGLSETLNHIAVSLCK